MGAMFQKPFLARGVLAREESARPGCYDEIAMTTLVALLRQNRNYRYTWMGQVVSEAGR